MTLVISGFLLPANEACEGNVFTGLSAHRAVSGQGGFCLGVSVQRGLCQGSHCPGGGSLSRGSLSRRPLSWESLSRGGSLSGRPPYGKEQAVRILQVRHG